MIRKIFVISLVVLSLTAVALSVYFVFAKEEEEISDTLYDAVPLDAGVIFDVRDFKELCGLVRGNALVGQLSALPSVKEFTQQILWIDSVFQSPDLSAVFQNHLIFSLHPSGKDDMQGIGYFKVNSEKEAKALIEKMQQRLTGKAHAAERQYDHAHVVDITFDGKDNQRYNFSCAYRSGIFVFSHSGILLENALRQIVADENITQQQQSLSELIKTAGKSVPINVYINYGQLPRTSLFIFHSKYQRQLAPLSRYADWTELDLSLKPDMLLLNGFTTPAQAPGHWLSILNAQPATTMSLVEAMPSTTYAYLWMGIRYTEKYFSDYGKYLDQYKESTYKKEVSHIKSSFGIDIQKDLVEMLENEVALVYARLGQTQPEARAFAVLRVKSAASAIAMVEKWQDASGSKSTATLQFDNQLTYKAYKLSFDVPAVFGDVFSGGNEWCVVGDNYMVFANSPDDLKKYLHYTALHASLQTDLSYGKLMNYFSTRSNITFYCNPAFAGGLLEDVMRPDRYKELQADPDFLSGFQAIGYQLNVSNNTLYNNIFLRVSTSGESVTQGMQTSWESLLDTSIAFKPQLVQNHNTGETEVFVQDMANNVYLLNNVGRILWKVHLPEPILGQVYQVDFYRNGKLQLLFNTPNYLYIIDRLGNFVDKYPVKLPSSAVGGLALFDYENNKNYRIMVACSNRSVYSYDKNGKAVDGWGFKQTEYPVRTDIYHYRADGKDYIVFADQYRTYILDRQGRTRVSPEYNFPVAQHTDIALDQSGRQARLALTDTSGVVHFISLPSGNISKKEIKKFPSDHFFIFQDIDGDRQNDFIFASGKHLEVFTQDGKALFGIETNDPIMLRPNIYEFGVKDIRIGIVQEQNIYLYNNNGKIRAGFPLKGSTLFSIGRIDKSSSQFNLFVGSRNNFLYNYSVK